MGSSLSHIGWQGLRCRKTCVSVCEPMLPRNAKAPQANEQHGLSRIRRTASLFSMEHAPHDVGRWPQRSAGMRAARGRVRGPAIALRADLRRGQYECAERAASVTTLGPAARARPRLAALHAVCVALALRMMPSFMPADMGRAGPNPNRPPAFPPRCPLRKGGATREGQWASVSAELLEGGSLPAAERALRPSACPPEAARDSNASS